MATFYHFDTVTNFVREQECFGILERKQTKWHIYF